MKLLRNILGGAAVLALIAGGWMVQRWHDKARDYDAAVEQREQLRADFNAYKDSVSRQKAASEGYQHEIQELRAAFDKRPIPVVRLCPQPAPVVPPTAAVAGGPEPAAPAAELVHGSAGQATGPTAQPGPDIGPGLYALAERADILSAQLRAILTLQGSKNSGH